MPIPVECDYCGARYQVPDQAAGKTIKCKSCAERISVGGSGMAGMPPRSTGAGKRKQPSKKAQSSSNNGLLIGGIIGGIALVAGVVAIVMMGSGGDEDAQNVAGNNAAASNEGGGFQQQDSNVAKPDQKQAAKAPTGAVFTKSAKWSVSPDPPRGETAFTPEQPLQVKLDEKYPRKSQVVFPVAPSPLAAVKSGSGLNVSYTVYDATTGNSLAEVKAPGSVDVAGLSEDGSYFAMAWSGGQKLDVWDIAENKSLGTLDATASGSKGVSHLALFGKERLVGLSQLDRAIRIWELPSGKLLREIQGGDKFSPNHGHTFSPGGRYLAAIGNFLTLQIQIYDLDSGSLAGTLSMKNKPSNSALGAIGFSRDGSQLALMYDFMESSQVAVWDLQSGNLATSFEIKPKLKEQLDPVYQSTTLESFPGNRFWLMHSLGVIDVDSQQLVYVFPKQDKLSLFPSRRVLGTTGVLSVSSAGQEFQLDVLDVTQDQLLAGSQTASAGGLPSDVGLPPLTQADFQQATAAETTDEWTFQLEPLEAQNVEETIRFETEGTVRDIVLSRNQAPLVAIRAGVNEDLNDPALAAFENFKKLAVEKGYDYKPVEPVGAESEFFAYQSNGDQSAHFKIPFSVQLRGVSPDGTQAVFEEHRTHGRLDVFEVSDEGRHVIAWRPYRTAEKTEHSEIRSAAFVDDDHVATLSMNSVLVVWNIRNLKPVWKRDDVIRFAVAPSGSSIVTVRGSISGAKAVSAFEGLTGKGLGSIELDGKTKSVALHPNSQWFALSQTSGPNNVVRILDLVKGELTEEFSVPATGTSLTWAGDDYLLLDGTQLISRPLQSVVWSYESDDVRLPPSQVTSELCVANQLNDNQAAIRSLVIPSGRVAARLDPGQLKNQAILSPDDSVAFEKTGSQDPLLQPLMTKGGDGFARRLSDTYRTVGGGPVVVSLKLTLESHGPTEVSKLGSRSEKQTVTRKSINMEITYQLKGKSIWHTTRKVGNLDRMFQKIEQGESVQDSIDRQMVETAVTVLSTFKLPAYIFGEDAARGLGTSKLIE